jgi:ribulose kinase
MPEVLWKFLESVDDAEAAQLWEYFDSGGQQAIDDIIEHVCETHPNVMRPSDDLAEEY